MKFLLFAFLFFFQFQIIFAVEFKGKFEQGSFILGKTEPGSKVFIDKRKIMQIFHDEEMRRMQKLALHKLQDEKLKELEAPPGILKKYLS